MEDGLDVDEEAAAVAWAPVVALVMLRRRFSGGGSIVVLHPPHTTGGAADASLNFLMTIIQSIQYAMTCTRYLLTSVLFVLHVEYT